MRGRRALLLLALLAGALPLAGQSGERQATFFVGRLRFGPNEGGDCGDVGHDLIRLVSRTSTIQVQQERKLALSDAALFETPFVFMNGHNDFTLSAAELENLGAYLSRGGFVFACNLQCHAQFTHGGIEATQPSEGSH